jgi:hydrogenase maturation protein HypF
MRKINKILYRKIPLPFKVKKTILAVGSHTKNTVCFAKGNFAYLSLRHLDLNKFKDYANFRKTLRQYLRKKPEIIAYDLHPEYQSTKFAKELSTSSYQLSAIQHHHAHIASCMAENRLANQKVIGVAFDGTGLGNDNTLWGAEFFICDYKNFKRQAHLKEIPLLGGERAISEPWRLATAWLYLVYKDRLLTLDIPFVKKIDKNKWQILKKMYLTGLNSPLTSSMGRLFDAVASLVLKKQKARLEAELAMELEKLADRYPCLPVRQEPAAVSYDFKIIKEKDAYILDPTPMFRGITADLRTKKRKEEIAYRFHLTVAQMLKKTCLRLRKKTKINKLVLSGGVFQNRVLTRLTLDLLSRERFRVFLHKDLACNDSGISLGQAMIANFSRPAIR